MLDGAISTGTISEYFRVTSLKARPPGVAVRSALRDAVRRPRMVFALLHRRVRRAKDDNC